jgi:integrase
MTFSELMDWGLSQEIMKAKATASADHNRASILKAFLGKYKASEVTPLVVENFRIKLKNTVSEKTGRPYSGTTVNKTVTLGRRIYYLAMDEGIVNSNPFARRGMYKEHPKGQYISDEEFWRIHGNLLEYLKPVAIAAYLTGMRRGELLELKWIQVDLDNGTLDLSADDTKTREPRVIYLASLPDLRRVFVEAKLRRRRGQKLVFTKEDGSLICKWTVGKNFSRASVKAGIGHRRFHDLRHTFTTNCLKAGVSRTVIMKLTGHKTLAMFLRYSHLDKEQSESAMHSLGELLESKRQKANG